MTTDELKGRVALVTGASRGLGQAFAVGLAKAGMAVALTGRTESDLAETLKMVQEAGAKGIASPADVRDRASIEQLVARVERELGSIDVLVNNAGVGEPFGPTWEVDPDEWWRCQEVNVRGPMLCSHAVLRAMVKRKRGRIINISSGAGTRSVPYMSAYVTSKAALIRFSEVLADEVREHGISVFAIQPGSVRTRMAEQILSSSAANKWFSWLEQVYERGENLTTEPATRLVLFLASGAADKLSGRFFNVAEDAKDVVSRAEEITAKDLYTLRMRFR
ncbi:MAG TPA: SDR family oxidoreductase [Candidatus Angelobacter sp.]|jgi:NAD(P)-dependent dehydrogenase (short-subunit alcohol dehydrogenase family)|nr:SDR family oxidoreductase [Candidatus Angelobacter sp.]